MAAIGIVERELAEFDGALDAPLAIEDGVRRGVDGVVVDVADGDAVAGDGVGLGDAAAHDAAAEDADLLDVFEFHRNSSDCVVRDSSRSWGS